MKTLNFNQMLFILFIGSLLLSNVSVGKAAFYQNDPLNRLTTVVQEDGTVISYTYDPVGNRTRMQVYSEAVLDNLPNDWEMEHFGNLDQGDLDDYDGDGETNLVEFNNDTDPADAASAHDSEHAYKDLRFALLHLYEQQADGSLLPSGFGVELICRPIAGKTAVSGQLFKPQATTGDAVVSMEILESGQLIRYAKSDYADFDALRNDFPPGQYRVEVAHSPSGWLRLKLTIPPYTASDLPDPIAVVSPVAGDEYVSLTHTIEFASGCWSFLEIRNPATDVALYSYARPAGTYPTSHDVAAEILANLTEYTMNVDALNTVHPIFAARNIVSFRTEPKKIIYVKWDAPGPHDGTSWERGHVSVLNGIGAAQAGEEVWVARGDYYWNGDSHYMKDGVNVLGHFAGTETLPTQRDLSNQDYETKLRADKTVIYGASNAILDGFTITGGATNTDGGGMYNDSKTNLRIKNCIISNNSAESFGGGMRNNYGSTVLVENSTFSENYAVNESGGAVLNRGASVVTFKNCVFSSNHVMEMERGGALFNEENSTVECLNCQFTGNYVPGSGDSGKGGAIYQSGGQLKLRNCTFGQKIPNHAAGDGGAIFVSGATGSIVGSNFIGNEARGGGQSGAIDLDCPDFWILDCEFQGNSAKFGGAMDMHYGGKVSNSLFMANTAQDSGGGIERAGNVCNCVFYGNSAVDDGGGIDGGGYVRNSIFWGNTAGDNGPQIENGGSVQYSCVQGGHDGEENIDADPLWVNPAIGDFHLQAGSPCIDAGIWDACVPLYDKDGTPRDAFPDMGAFEYVGASPIVALDDLYSADTGTTLTVEVEAGVLANDEKPIGVAPLVFLLSNTGHGELALAGDGAFTYLSDPGFVGVDGFTYKARNGWTDSNPARVTLIVGAPMPELSISGGQFLENAGIAIAKVALSAPSMDPVAVDLKTIPGTAEEGEDFIPIATRLNWSPGEYGVREVKISLIDDNLQEPEEIFMVELFNSSNADIAQTTGTIMIVNDDKAVVSLRVEGPSVVDEESGAQYACFADFDDGSSEVVTGEAGWSDNSPVAGISRGYLTTLTVAQDEECCLTVIYKGKMAERCIQISNSTIKSNIWMIYGKFPTPTPIPSPSPTPISTPTPSPSPSPSPEPTATFIPTATPTPTPGIVFIDDFSGPTLSDNWETFPNGGTIEIVNGWLRIQLANPDFSEVRLVAPDTQLVNMSVTFDLDPKSSGVDNQVSVVSLREGGGKRYAAYFQQSASKVYIARWIDESREVLNIRDYTVVAGRFRFSVVGYSLSIEKMNDQIVVETILSASDAAEGVPGPGTVRLGVNQEDALFDNIIVENLGP
jgi:YD repeat-containing protein